MYKIRYVENKTGPASFSHDDWDKLATATKSTRPGFYNFGTAPAHPDTIPGKIGAEYSDKYRGDKK